MIRLNSEADSIVWMGEDEGTIVIRCYELSYVRTFFSVCLWIALFAQKKLVMALFNHAFSPLC